MSDDEELPFGEWFARELCYWNRLFLIVFALMMVAFVVVVKWM